MKKLLTLTALLLACHAVHAGQPAAAKAAPTVTGTNATAAADYTPKAKSAFTGGSNDHNPFWPIGWVKMEETSTADTAAPVVPKAEDFSVTSILLNEPPIAVINGKEMAEGEIGAIPIPGGNVMVQLMAVQDGRVVLRWENQNLIIPLHREEQLSPADLSTQPTVGLR